MSIYTTNYFILTCADRFYTCPKLSLENGNITYSEVNETSPILLAILTCHEHYRLQGTVHRFCLENDKPWTGQAGHCGKSNILNI